MARAKRIAGMCESCDPCPVCGCTLFVVKRKRGKGRECLYCKTNLFSNADLPAASSGRAVSVAARPLTPASAQRS